MGTLVVLIFNYITLYTSDLWDFCHLVDDFNPVTFDYWIHLNYFLNLIFVSLYCFNFSFSFLLSPIELLAF